MSAGGAGLRSLAVSFPRTIRTNDYWHKKHPEMVATAAERDLARVWSAPEGRPVDETPFTATMAPFLRDPFRGAIARRVLAPGETALSIELDAARRAMAAAHTTVNDLDLVIVSSFLPDTIGVGNAAFVANALGFEGPAWNLETACSSALVALQNACALVRTGEYRNVLVVISCTYSRVTPPTDSLSWSTGDGAAAFVVGPTGVGEGVLSFKTVNTAKWCGAMYYELVGAGADDLASAPSIRMRAGSEAGAALRETAARGLVECCQGAAKAAGVTLDDIDFFAVPTPLAWYAEFCARTLGFPIEKTLSTHSQFANTGPVLMPTNLYHAAREGRVRPGQLVMLHTIGIVSNASAAVVRWGDVALGEPPESGIAEG